MKVLLRIILLSIFCVSCGSDPQRPKDQDESLVPASRADAVAYSDLRDPLRDAGQFFLPLNTFTPKGYWYVAHTDYAGRENPSRCTSTGDGLQGYLLMHSVVGLINKAAMEGKTDYCAWMAERRDQTREFLSTIN